MTTVRFVPLLQRRHLDLISSWDMFEKSSMNSGRVETSLSWGQTGPVVVVHLRSIVSGHQRIGYSAAGDSLRPISRLTSVRLP